MRDGFVGAVAGEAARALDGLEGWLAPAAMGKRRVLRPELRGDHTAWLEDLPARPALDALRGRLEDLGQTLSAELRLGLGAPLVQVARFAPGTGYTRHRDAFRDDPARRMTAVLYLNPGWEERDGGQLRVWEPDGARDVLPALDRLVLFRADAVEHEVLPARRARWAVTAWFGSPGSGAR